MLWDRGDWEPVGNPQAGIREGKLNFDTCMAKNYTANGLWFETHRA